MNATPLPVIDVLAAMLDFRKRWVRGLATTSDIDSSTAYRFEAFPVEGKWQAEELDTGYQSSYDATTQIYRRDDVEVTRSSYPLFPVHPAVSLLFPLELPVWGRSRDDWKPASAEQLGQNAVILFTHRSDSVIKAALDVDLRRGHAVRWTSPMGSVVCELDDGGLTS